MFNLEGLMSSKKMDYTTPSGLYRALNGIFSFDFDPCPLNPKFDGLSIEWGKRNYVNPPYGTAIKHWVKKSWQEAQKGKTVVMLIPSRTDTIYWHDYVMRAHEVWLIKGRLKFGNKEGSAPFPSAIVIFSGNAKRDTFPVFKSVGTCAQYLR